MSKSYKFAAQTDIGLVREGNEDNFGLIQFDSDFPFVAVVADGMGGHLNGELASKIAVEYVQERLRKDLPMQDDSEKIQSLLNDVIQKANIKVYLSSLETPKNKGMGTTLTIAVFYEHSVYVVHIGDSRAYLLRNRYLDALTTDHTVVREMQEAGTITLAEMATHPQRHMLTQALGSAEYLTPSFTHIDLKKHDRYLLCSDGLHGYVSYANIENTLIQSETPQEICQSLIQQALSEGGMDNITVITIVIE